MRNVILSLFLICLVLPGARAQEEVADLVVVHKAQRTLQLLRGGQVLAEYQIALGDQPLGHKQSEGDERTPEGAYVIDWKNNQSAFHLSLRISYPNNQDRQAAAALGLDPGGDIFIHGQPNGWSFLDGILQGFDWTDGCIAVTDEEIEEIWALVEIGTPIIIYP